MHYSVNLIKLLSPLSEPWPCGTEVDEVAILHFTQVGSGAERNRRKFDHKLNFCHK